MLFLGGFDDAGSVTKVMIALVARQGDLCRMVEKPPAFEQSFDHLIGQFTEDVHKASDLISAAVSQRGCFLSIGRQPHEA